MSRIKRGLMAHKRRKNILKQTKGYINSRSTKFRAAKEAVLHAGVHSFRGRKLKKRTFRALWQAQINAACRQNDLTYSKFIAGLKKAKIEIDRKILANLAQNEPKVFLEILKMG
ncbi:MAG: 50S ribosomal protein L20 [Candidatus Portnoybacteria bacterium CG06_land_8_20_14_3_00_39_12]|uniref:Large ribosomal subunit protein bL20 n=3 Tax=Candidatus Portnoyibacteriota TaxID=1817913 RepID=A0A2M8KFA7_9BACT|nr:MAG: 50S ribosomal protein L20 [Parcubacteria group bacterium CG1_02_40_25]PIU74990.1 MAG: 50S ribosomal protein L20 [Candidatus Portnoybacteria bacterium CG06_land_8_20_14_3_00_39_12]PIZ70948.1 MAG: 50S ribosomal protein L20 [Candidatus Portnoybacteria bacterium CG_4_10_14_0_2_um_filter_39_11]PJE58584.1 MAG: 50S ribosomal protein L20 [Candidatus Portnoybacteria bacterium CG10_big_fil_rev_8_21_14_0_10_40_22]